MVLWTTLTWIGINVCVRLVIAILVASSGWSPLIPAAAVTLLNLADSALLLLGVWWLTTAEHDQPTRYPKWPAIGGRFLLVLGIVVHNGNFLFNPWSVSISPMAFGWIGLWLALGGWSCLLFHMRILALRMGAPKLASFLQTTGWTIFAVTLGAAMLLIGPFVAMLAAPASVATAAPIFALAGCCGSLVLPVAFCCAIIGTAQLTNKLEAVRQNALITRDYLPRTMHTARAVKPDGGGPTSQTGL